MKLNGEGVDLMIQLIGELVQEVGKVQPNNAEELVCCAARYIRKVEEVFSDPVNHECLDCQEEQSLRLQ